MSELTAHDRAIIAVMKADADYRSIWELALKEVNGDQLAALMLLRKVVKMNKAFKLLEEARKSP